MAQKKNTKEQSLEQTLWQAADKLRKNIDAAEYKHIVLGLIFLKYISDAFEEKRGQLELELANPNSEWYMKESQERYEVMEDPDEYRAENVFFVPAKARWPYLQSVAKQPEIGKYVDEAMIAIEKENPTLKGVLPKVYARPNLDKQSLGGLIDLIGTIVLGDVKARSQDLLGRVYEYFLGQFALAEGKKGGQFYTPASIVKLLVAMIEPYEGRVFDPCCGSGGMKDEQDDEGYQDIKGFCRSATLDEIRKHNYVLTPGRYVGIPDEEDDGIPFEEKIAVLTTELKSQMQEGEALDQEIKTQLVKIGIEL